MTAENAISASVDPLWTNSAVFYKEVVSHGLYITVYTHAYPHGQINLDTFANHSIVDIAYRSCRVILSHVSTVYDTFSGSFVTVSSKHSTPDLLPDCFPLWSPLLAPRIVPRRWFLQLGCSTRDPLSYSVRFYWIQRQFADGPPSAADSSVVLYTFVNVRIFVFSPSARVYNEYYTINNGC